MATKKKATVLWDKTDPCVVRVRRGGVVSSSNTPIRAEVPYVFASEEEARSGFTHKAGDKYVSATVRVIVTPTPTTKTKARKK